MDEFEQIRRAMQPTPDVDPEAEERAWKRLETTIAEGEGDRAPGGFPSSPNRYGRRRVIVAIAAVLALGLVIALVPTFLPEEIVPPRTAKAYIDELAATAEAEPALVAGEGEYVYNHSRAHSLQYNTNVDTGLTWRTFVDIDREQWLANDGSGRLVRRYSNVEFITPGDRHRWIEAGRPPLSVGVVQDDRLAPGDADVLDLSALPTEPEALLVEIEQREIVGGPPGDVQTFDIVAQLLGDPGASPELRGALFEVAGLLDGVELTGQRTDPLGRQGIGIALEDGRKRVEIIVAATDSRLLAHLTTHRRRDNLDSWTAHLGTGVTSSTGEQPR